MIPLQERCNLRHVESPKNAGRDGATGPSGNFRFMPIEAYIGIRRQMAPIIAPIGLGDACKCGHCLKRDPARAGDILLREI